MPLISLVWHSYKFSIMHNTLKTIFILRRQIRNIDLRSCMSCAKLQTPFLVIFSTTMHNTLKSSAVINRPGFQNIKLLLSVQLSKSGLQFLISGLLEEEVCIFSLSKLYVKMLCECLNMADLVHCPWSWPQFAVWIPKWKSIWTNSV